MVEPDAYLEASEAPADRPVERIDARELPPPQPLRRTLETLADLDESTVVVQYNDRAPMHLYPKLDDRGYRYETREDDDMVVTIIWKTE